MLDALVPTMILQPLVENAIKHGIERIEGPGRVVVNATAGEGMLVLRVWDNGPGPCATDSAATTAHAPSGVGLRNTVARLAQLYGAHARFTLDATPKGGTVAEIRLPLHRATSPAAGTTPRLAA